ncbi:MAG: 3D-(3,5/4)-trihydroxycyclohexane-1,2-dione acylhydrolase (decyclizing) [Pseudomonadota bacterium]
MTDHGNGDGHGEGGRGTVRRTVAQALIDFLAVQESEMDGARERLVQGVFGIFGHGNVPGFGEALAHAPAALPFYPVKNEQSGVHVAMGFAKAKNRRATLAATASIGPGSTNMITGAATATINRVPVLCLPSDIYAHRRSGIVLQELEHPVSADVSVNDAFRPVSTFFDRVSRPEQLLTALPEAMRHLTDPVLAGAVTVSLPQDVQGEAYDFPARFFEPRVWHIVRHAPDRREIADAAEVIATAEHPILIAGGGVRYAGAEAELVALCNALDIPVFETHAGKGTATGAKLALGGGGLTGTRAAEEIARQADLVIAVGTRLTDFTTASRSLFAPATRTVGLNVHPRDAYKLGATPIVADAKLGLAALNEALKLRGWRASPAFAQEAEASISRWLADYKADIGPRQGEAMGQGEIIGHVNRAARRGDIVVAAAGTPPGEIMKGFDCGQTLGERGELFLEFGYSCMGHELPAGIGARLARQNEAGEIYVVIGDGTFLMAPSDLATAVQEGLKITIILIDNSGYQCIRSLQEATSGVENYGNEFVMREEGGAFARDYAPIDHAKIAEGLGATAIAANTPAELDAALEKARGLTGSVAIIVPAHKRRGTIGAGAWWDLGVAETSDDARTKEIRSRFEDGRRSQVYHGA